MSTKCVCYAITSNEPFQSMVLRSIRSLKQHNKSIQVHLFCFGPANKTFRHRVAALQVTLHQRPPIGRLYPYFIKWLVLHRIKEDRVLFLDADTILYDDVERLFRKYRRAHFYARREIGSMVKTQWIGSKKMWKQIDHNKMNAIFKSIKGRRTPVFNTGVMIFNHKAHQLVRPNTVRKYFNQLTRGQHRYPSPNHFIRDEIAYTMALSKLKRFTWSALRKQSAPFYFELREKAVLNPGIVLHVWTSLYKEYLRNSPYKPFANMTGT